MELKEMIEAGTTKISGEQQRLAELIGISPKALCEAKAGRRGLPNIACGKLAEILEIDRWSVVAASDLVTETNPEKRAYLSPFVHTASNVVAVLALSLVTLFVTPTPAEASSEAKTSFMQCALCQLRLQALMARIAALVRNSMQAVLPRFDFAG